jgi:hypothetical protein
MWTALPSLGRTEAVGEHDDAAMATRAALTKRKGNITTTEHVRAMLTRA